MKIFKFSRKELRQWFLENHKTEKECFIIVSRNKNSADSGLNYLDALEEALCFGWIDSTLKYIHNELV